MRRPKTNFLLAEGRMGSSLGLPRTGDQRRRSDGGQAELDPRHPLLANCGRGRRCRVGTSRQCRRRRARPAGGSYLHTETNPDGRFELSGLGFGAIFCLGRPEGRIHLRTHRSTGVNRRTAGANRPRPRPRSQRANPLPPTAEPCRAPFSSWIRSARAKGSVPSRPKEDGSFTATVPAEARLAHLQVQAPSHLLWAGLRRDPRNRPAGGDAPAASFDRDPTQNGLSGTDHRCAAQSAVAAGRLLPGGEESWITASSWAGNSAFLARSPRKRDSARVMRSTSAG